MHHVINYKTEYNKELYRLYCSHHNLIYDYEHIKKIEEAIPDINVFKIKLFRVDDKIRGYVFYRQMFGEFEKDTLTVNEIYMDKVYASRKNYLTLLTSLNKGILSKHNKHLRLQFQSNDKRREELVSLLELDMEKKVFEMKIDLNRRIEVATKGNIEFISFRKGADEIKRVKIQNSIFKDTKGHIDCNLNDILYEEKQDYYLEDGATFLSINGNIAGYSQIIVENKPLVKPYIVNFGIDSNYRNKGLSKQLLYYTLHLLVQKGFRKAYITVDSDNRKAYNLYKKAGFEKVNTMISYLYKY